MDFEFLLRVAERRIRLALDRVKPGKDLETSVYIWPERPETRGAAGQQCSIICVTFLILSIWNVCRQIRFGSVPACVRLCGLQGNISQICLVLNNVFITSSTHALCSCDSKLILHQIQSRRGVCKTHSTHDGLIVYVTYVQIVSPALRAS